ncbi:hypothetical protein [Nocardia sp. NPDC052566]|uniref:PD-(D/E)XK nuclease domain-containing protein n=1 Tax=Nocardia sp. NPDC052566 TaxID=3364330 RepID=UPI0037CC3905
MTIEGLIEQSRALEGVPAGWQSLVDDPSAAQEVEALRDSYRTWYKSCLRILPGDGTRAKFVGAYEGTTLFPGVRSFLAEPLRRNVLFKWQFSYEHCYRRRVATQREVLVALDFATMNPAVVVFDELEAMLQNFAQFVRTMQMSKRSNIQVSVETEFDLQPLVEAVLRLHYGDVRSEEYVPSYGGANSRVDFYLRAHGIMVETKMTRRGLRDKEIGDELIIDMARYRRHPDCRAVLALIYDPDGWLTNPEGIEHDLRSGSQELPLRVVVAR